MSLEVYPIVSKTSKKDSSSEESSVDSTGEIVDFLIERLHSQRKPIEQTVFDRDHQMYRRVGQYEKALTAFLANEPRVLSIGDDMRKREIWLEVVSQSYQQEIDGLDQQSLDFQIQREEATDSLQNLKVRIAGIGRERFGAGDLGLLLGRVQVELYSLKQKGRLNILGRFVERLIGSSPVHPQVEPIQNQLTAANEKVKELEERRSNLAAEHFRKENEQKHRLKTEREKLFYELDAWAIGSSERFLVHYFYYYYQRPSLKKYFKNHQLTDADLKIFEQHSLLQKRKQPQQQSEDPSLETLAKDIADLPMPIKIRGEIFTDIDSARKAFLKLKEDVPQSRMKHFFNRSLMALRYEAQGSHHPDYRVFASDDPIIERVGGNGRLRIGRYRVIGNLDNMENEQRVPEFVTILQHDDPNYR